MQYSRIGHFLNRAAKGGKEREQKGGEVVGARKAAGDRSCWWAQRMICIRCGVLRAKQVLRRLETASNGNALEACAVKNSTGHRWQANERKTGSSRVVTKQQISVSQANRTRNATAETDDPVTAASGTKRTFDTTPDGSDASKTAAPSLHEADRPPEPLAGERPEAGGCSRRGTAPKD